MPSTSLTHYGIAVGGRSMIHLVPESEQNWFLGKGLYEEVNIVEYCLDTKKTCERDNSRDARDGWIPYHPWQVVERAYSKLGDSFEGCSVIFKDCKKFALWCRYRNQRELGDQSSAAKFLGSAAFTLGAGALALGAALQASSAETNECIIANSTSSSVANTFAKTASGVAKKSAIDASLESVSRMVQGKNPILTFTTEFASNFVSGMITEIAHNAESSTMTSENAIESCSGDSNGENEFWAKCVLEPSVASSSRAVRNRKSPAGALNESYGEYNGMEGVVDRSSVPFAESKQQREF